MAFERLNRTVLHTGRVFTVAQHTLRLPNGKSQTYDLVEHEGAVTILPLDETGNIWFVRQYRLGAERSLLELPAGVLHAEKIHWKGRHGKCAKKSAWRQGR